MTAARNTNEDIDRDWYSLPEFIKLCVQGEMIALDMLHAEPSYGSAGNSPEWVFIQQNRWRFYTKNMKAFLGYARKQASKYGIKGSRMAALEEVYNAIEDKGLVSNMPLRLDVATHSLPVNDYCKFVSSTTKQGDEQHFYEVLGSKFQLSMPLEGFVKSITAKWESYGARAKAAKENEGVDWKAVSHALRAGCQLKEIYQDGTITYPLKDREFLLNVKLGKLDFLTEVQPALEGLIAEVEWLAETSNYPEKVDMKFWDDFLLSCYK